MRTAARWLLVGWLLAALGLLGLDGKLPEFLAGAASGSLLLLGLSSLVHQQLTPSRYNRPSTPERYRVADDLRQPIAAVVAVAEHDAMTAPPRRQMAPDGGSQIGTAGTCCGRRWVANPYRCPHDPVREP